MRRLIAIFFLFFIFALHAVDYDCVVVGTSPIPLFEALYQSSLGKKVLILEKETECGGAWKSISACGIDHVDMGCHQVGSDRNLANFLETYAGCKIVSMDNPLAPYSSSKSGGSFYFSRGCFELIDQLLKIISKSSLHLLLNHRLEKITFNMAKNCAVIHSKGKTFTTNKIYVSRSSAFDVEQLNSTSQPIKYYHLYLLIADSSSPRFSYKGYSKNASRIMNLTHFVGLTNSGQQLIVIQTSSDKNFSQEQEYIEDLRKNYLIDKSAYLLRSDSYIYQQGSGTGRYYQLDASKRSFFEVLNTGSFSSMGNYINKWKGSLTPYCELFP